MQLLCLESDAAFQSGALCAQWICMVAAVLAVGIAASIVAAAAAAEG